MIIRTRVLLSLALGLACLAHAGPTRADDKAPVKGVVFNGKVTELPKQAGAVALTCTDGKVYPLIEDDHSRMLFKDPGLRGRDVRLTGTVQGDRLQVTRVQTIVNGKPLDVYYWCANCLLSYTEPGPCMCCGELVKRVEAPTADAK